MKRSAPFCLRQWLASQATGSNFTCAPSFVDLGTRFSFLPLKMGTIKLVCIQSLRSEEMKLLKVLAIEIWIAVRAQNVWYIRWYRSWSFNQKCKELCQAGTEDMDCSPRTYTWCKGDTRYPTNTPQGSFNATNDAAVMLKLGQNGPQQWEATLTFTWRPSHVLKHTPNAETVLM